MERRDFIKSATAASLAAASSATLAQQSETSSPTSKQAPVSRPENPAMIYRELGTTGERVSAIGMGGFHLAKDPSTTAQDAIRLVRSASDHGITFFDNCWDYNDGISEVRLGQALKDGYRQKAFVMTKLDARTAKDYDKHLSSLWDASILTSSTSSSFMRSSGLKTQIVSLQRMVPFTRPWPPAQLARFAT